MQEAFKVKNTEEASRRPYGAWNSVMIFSLGIAIMILVIIVLNVLGLSPFYEQQKIRTIKEAYERINAGVEASDPAALSMLLDEYSEKNNLSIALVDSGNNQAIVTSERDGEMLLRRFQDYLFGSDGEEEKQTTTVIEENENYRIVRLDIEPKEDEAREKGVFSSIELFGYCKDNSTLVLMSTPIESMKESARVAGRFLIIAAGAAVLVGFAAVYVMSVRAARIRELEEKNEALVRDLEEKERQNKIKQEFIANVSHELKTPIAVIQGYAEGLADGMCEDEESRKYYADIIVDEAGRMNRIVRELLLLSSLESGLDEPEMEPFCLSEMAEGLTARDEVLCREKNAALIRNIPEGIFVLGDEYKIESVFTNYLSNAIHHVNEGGRIEVSLQPGEAKDTVRCTVYNSGSEIPEEDLENIWGKFYKVDKARSRSYGGSGIGLSIVRAVMEAHQGGYGVRNTGDGVVFWFELKKAEPPQDAV